MEHLQGNADSSDVMKESATICEVDDFSARIDSVLAEYKKRLAIVMKQPKTTRRPENMLHAPFILPRPGTNFRKGRGKHCRVHGSDSLSWYHGSEVDLNHLRSRVKDKRQGVKSRSTLYCRTLGQSLCRCQPGLTICVEGEDETCTSSVLERDVGRISLT